MSVMRGSIWPGLLAAASANLARQQERVRFFEIGKTFHGTLDAPREVVRVSAIVTGTVVDEQWGSQSQGIDFFDIKSDLETLFAMTGMPREFRFVPTEHVALQPGQAASILRNDDVAGLVGRLHPQIAKQYDLGKGALVFELDADRCFAATVPSAQAISKYPAIRRDIALVVGEDISAADLTRAAESAAPELVRSVRIFDVYQGPGIEAGLKSVALGLILQETSRTLTDEDADTVMSAVLRKMQQDFGAELRD
jgi:phenylalanyl-tRNA synthetase beta chain